MPPLTSSQRKHLRQMAHHLDPAVLIGKQGVTDLVVRSIVEALEARELIKIKFNDHKDQKKELMGEIEGRTGGETAGIVGHVAILFKRQDDEEKRRIELPGA